MKFLQISDLHILADRERNEDVRNRLLAIRERYRFETETRYLIVTGDIIDNEGAVLAGTPLPAELRGHTYFEYLASPIFCGPGIPLPFSTIPGIPSMPPSPCVQSASTLNPAHVERTEQAFANATKLLEPFRGQLLLCPGNHDFRLLGVLRHPEFIRLYEAFEEPFHASLNGVRVGSLNHIKAWYFAAFGVLIICLDSNGDGRVHRPPITTADAIVPIYGSGKICEDQLDELDMLLTSPAVFLRDFPCDKVRTAVLFMHHDPEWSDPLHGLENGEELKKRIRGRVDLLLFGHRHLMKRFTPHGPHVGRHGALAGGFFGFVNHHRPSQKVAAWEFEIIPGGRTTPDRISTPQEIDLS